LTKDKENKPLWKREIQGYLTKVIKPLGISRDSLEKISSNILFEKSLGWTKLLI